MLLVLTNDLHLDAGVRAIFNGLHIVNCDLKILVIDTSSPNALAALKGINAFNICAMFLIVKKKQDRKIFEYINFPFPVHYVVLSDGIEKILENINYIIFLLSKKKLCNYKVIERKNAGGIPDKKLMVLRMHFSGLSLNSIATELMLSNKSVSSYIGSSMKVLNMDLSTNSMNLMNAYNQLLIFSLSLAIDCVSCPLRKVYVKMAG